MKGLEGDGLTGAIAGVAICGRGGQATAETCCGGRRGQSRRGVNGESASSVRLRLCSSCGGPCTPTSALRLTAQRQNACPLAAHVPTGENIRLR